MMGRLDGPERPRVREEESAAETGFSSIKAHISAVKLGFNGVNVVFIERVGR